MGIAKRPRMQLQRLDAKLREIANCRKQLEAAVNVQAEIDKFVSTVRTARRSTYDFTVMDRLLDQLTGELWRLEETYGLRES